MGKRKRSSKNKINKKISQAKRNKTKSNCHNESKSKNNQLNEEPQNSLKSERVEKTAFKAKIIWIFNHVRVKNVVRSLITIIIIPILITQGLNAYNAKKDAEEALQAAIRQIYINYEAGNYSEMEQDVYNIYPQLQKKKDYKTLLSLTDMLLGSLYQEFYMNQLALPQEQEELILLYANNALGYAEKLNDITSYIKICIHTALFNISEYEFTLNTKYLDNAEFVLNIAGEYYDEKQVDKNHTPKLLIADETDANLACQFFNLKNLQYQVSCYRAAIGYPFDDLLDNVDQSVILDPNMEQIDPYTVLDDLSMAAIQFISTVYIIEAQNSTLELIPEDQIQHMKILAGVAYIEFGNLMYNFGDIVPLVLRDEATDTPHIIYVYDDVDICADLFNTLENAAVNIKNYEDLAKVYKSAETYYYLKYVSNNSDDLLVKYEEIIEKLLELDPSGDILSSRIIETGNSFILDKYIENTENRLSKMTFMSDPFAFSLLKYKLGTHYQDRASFRDKLGDVMNAKLDYESARKCYNTALLYFTQENAGIFEDIHRMQDIIIERLSMLDK